MQLAERIWAHAVHGLFLLLCIRFQVGALAEAAPNFGVVAVLIFGPAVLAYWRSNIFLAFVFAVPAISGLGNTILQSGGASLSLVFSGIVLGTTAQSITGRRRTPSNDVRAPLDGIAVTSRLLLTTIVISLATRLVASRAHLGPFLWKQAVFGWSDPYYFLTSAFIWCQGFFFLEHCRKIQPSARIWLRPILWVWVASMAVFFLIQKILNAPEALMVGTFEGLEFSYAYFSPFDDLHSFGSIAVALLALWLALWPQHWRENRLGAMLGLVALLLFIGFSFARATWVTTGVVLLMAARIHLKSRWTMILVALLLAGIAVINTSKSEAWTHHSYLYRLKTLVRLEKPSDKLSSRFFVFHKALQMIATRPLTGFGIGSFYLTSVQFAKANDPLAQKPDFAHDLFLQFAAELGVPATAILIGVIALALIKGFRQAWDQKSLGLPFAAAFGLSAYLLTQLTAHALNIFVSNQFIFWFLVAVVLPPIAQTVYASPKAKRDS